MAMHQNKKLGRAARGLVASVAALLGLAGHVPEAAADYASQCLVCHGAIDGGDGPGGATISGARINAANAGGIIQRALDLGLMAVAAVDTAAIATEIGNANTPYTQTVNFNFNQTANITVNKLNIPSNFIDRLEQTGAVAGTNLPVANSTTFQYNHPGGNCNSVNFTLRGREGAAGVVTSTRAVTVNINNPTLTATSASYAIPYSTGAQAINTGGNFSANPAGSGPAGTLNFVGGLSPALGSRAATGATSFTYASDATTYAPTVTQQYSIDGQTACGTSNTATATINVGLPPAPVVATFAQTVPAVGATNINLLAPVRITGVILQNPSATFNVVASQPTAPGSGTTSVAGNTIIYTPPGGAFTGPTTITYTKDGPGGTSNVGTITLNVTAAPVGTDSSAGPTPFNTPIMVDVGPLIAGSFTTVNSGPAATGGTTSVAGSVVTFTPTPGFFGNGSFTYTATGPGGTSTPNTVTVQVLPPPPTANPGVAAGSFQTPSPIDVAPFIVGVTSPPPVAAFNAVSGTINSVVGTIVTFTPAPGFIGAATFQYNATGPGGTSGTATVTVNVAAPPPPVASNVSVLVSATTPTQIDLASSITGFVNNVTLSSPPLLGTATASGVVVTYTPIANNPGMVTFQYIAVGPGGPSAPATVTMTYTTAPVTPNRAFTVPFNTPTPLDLMAMTAGVVSSLNIVTQPANGTVLVRGNVITYTPNTGFFGADSFTYSATGPGGTSVPGVVSLTVVPPIPQPTDGAVNVAFNTPTPINLASFVAGVATSFTITTAPQHGTISISGNIATYTPAPGFFGTDTFQFAAVNGAGTSAPATITLTVGSLKPLAGAATMTVALNTSGSLDLAPFISGSGVIGVSIAKQAAHGTVTVNGTVVTYTPRHNFFGPDSFQYVAFGNLGSSPTPGVVTVTVTGRPDPSQDPSVRGLVDAQTATPSRFSRAQITNVQRRLETLHRGPDSAFPAAPPKVPKEPAPEGAAPGTPPAGASPPAAPSARMNPANPGAAQGATAASGLAASPLVSSLIGLAASQSVSLDGASTLRDGTSVWMGGLAQFGDVEGNGERSGLRFSTDGLTVGADRRINDRLALGVSAGYARDETRIGNDGSKSKARGTAFGVYSSYQPTGNTYVDALLGIGKIDFDSTRFVEPFDAFATGRRKADQFFGSVAAGYEWRRDGILVSPYGRFDFSYDKLKEATESGADQYNLRYAGQTLKSTQLGLGVRAEAQHDMEYGRVVPRVRAEYRRELQGDRNGTVSYADLLGGPEYTVTSSGVSRNALLLGVGADFLLSGGLKLGIDYQAERASGAHNVQAWRLFVSQDLDFKGLPAFRFNNDMLEKPISVDFGFAHDDNVSRGRLNEEKRQDNITSIGIGQEWIKPLGTNLRLLATPQITAEKFRRFAGLGRFSGGIQGELQYRGSAAFDATTFGLRGVAIWDQYESRLRTGSRFFLGVNARRSVTDKIDLFGEVGGNARYGRSDVFEVRDYSVKGNVDYSLGKNGTLYFSGEYRRGDTFASGVGNLTNLALADVFVADDAFESEGFFAYRIEARGVLGTFGYNRPLGPRDSLDFSFRRVQITPTNKPGFETGSLRYNDNQYSIVYLIRF